MKVSLQRVGLAFGVCGLMIVTAAVCRAETGVAEESGRVVRLGEIVVIGERAERNLLQTPTLESAALEIASSVVESETIRRSGAATWSDALDLSTGLFTEKRGRKEKHLSSFRGQIYPYPDIALNGIWQRSFWEVPAFLPAVAIDRIEVLRSGGSILTGPNSGLVGAVNIVPRRFDEPTTILDVQGGSYKTFRSSLVHGDRFEKGDYTAGASFYRTSGPRRENAAEHFSSLFGTGSWEPVADLRIEFTGFMLHGERELRLIQEPGMMPLRKREERYAPYTSYGAVVRSLLSHDDDSSTTFDFAWVLRDGKHRRIDPDKPEVKNRERDWELNGGIMHAHKLSDANTLRAGLQYNHWLCPDGKRHFVGSRMDVHTFSGVIVDEHQWERLTLDGGLRVTRNWYRDYTETTFNIAGDNLSAIPVYHEWDKPAITVTLGAKYRLSDPLALYAHAAYGSLDVPGGSVARDDEHLSRESRTILDAGLIARAEGVGTLKAGGFTALRYDALLLDTTEMTHDGDLFNTYVNGDVRQYGLELEGQSVMLCDTFSLFANLTAMNSSHTTDDGRRRYREIPQIVAGGGINAVYGRLDANLYVKHISRFHNRRFAQDGNYHKLGDFVDVGLTAGLTLGSERRTRLYCSIENLLNDHYSTVVGYPDYGIQLFVGLQHTL